MEAKLTGWKKYYEGTVERVNDDGTYDIKFDDGERKRGVESSQIKHRKHHHHQDKLDDNIPTTSTYICNDRVEAKCAGWAKYFAGTVTKVNEDGTYDIAFDDGEKKSGVQLSEIKGKAVASFSVHDRIVKNAPDGQSILLELLPA